MEATPGARNDSANSQAVRRVAERPLDYGDGYGRHMEFQFETSEIPSDGTKFHTVVAAIVSDVFC